MGEIARALFPFQGQENGDLTFNEDDIIVILKKDESGWWEGETEDGRRGDFPYNYVEIIQRSEAEGLREASRQVSNPYQNRGGAALKSDAIQRIVVVPVPDKPVFNVEANIGRKTVRAKKTMENFRDLDLQLRYLYPNFDRPLPPYWADKVYENESASRRRAKVLQIYLQRLVGNGNEVNEFAVVSWLNPRESFSVSPNAKASVKEAMTDAQKRGGGRNSHQAAIANAYPLARAEYEWNATDAVELPLQPGAIIAVRNQQTPSAGWWEGETSDGQRGLFPSNYVTMMSQNESRQVVLGQAGKAPIPQSMGFQTNVFASPGPARLGAPVGGQKAAQKGKMRQRKTENNFAMPSLDAFDELLLEGFTMLQNNRVLIPKPGAQSPGEGDTVSLSYTAYVWDCQKQRIIEFASSDLPDASNKVGPLKFCVGRGETIKALERAVQNLEIGEESRIVVRPDMGYGEVGSPPSVPPNCHLVYDVKLEGVEGTGLPPPPMESAPISAGLGMRPPPGDLYKSPSQQGPPRPYAAASAPPPGNMMGSGKPAFSGAQVAGSLADAVASRALQMGQGHRSNAPIQSRPRKKVHQPQYVDSGYGGGRGNGTAMAPRSRQPGPKYGLEQMKEIVLNKSYERYQVDPAFLEDSLTDEGFQEAFNCTRAQFLLMQKWKQNKLKQDAGLY